MPRAVSERERGECCPDITLPPAIAGCFNISVDELPEAEEGLRGPPFNPVIAGVERRSLEYRQKLIVDIPFSLLA